jgi:hypothetical protein
LSGNGFLGLTLVNGVDPVHVAVAACVLCPVVFFGAGKPEE